MILSIIGTILLTIGYLYTGLLLTYVVLDTLNLPILHTTGKTAFLLAPSGGASMEPTMPRGFCLSVELR